MHVDSLALLMIIRFSHHQITSFFVILLFSFTKYECRFVFYENGTRMQSIKIPGSCDSCVKKECDTLGKLHLLH